MKFSINSSMKPRVENIFYGSAIVSKKKTMISYLMFFVFLRKRKKFSKKSYKTWEGIKVYVKDKYFLLYMIKFVDKKLNWFFIVCQKT